MKMLVRVFALVVTLVWPLSVEAQSFTPKLTLSWTDKSSDELGFAVERGTQQSGPFAEVAQTAANTGSWVDTTVTARTVYCCRVRAWNERTINSQIEKNYSAYSNVTCGSSVPAPETPTDLLLSAQEHVDGARALLNSASSSIAKALRERP